jgi:hypothetical protein
MQTLGGNLAAPKGAAPMKNLPLQQSVFNPLFDDKYRKSERPYELWHTTDPLIGVHALVGRYRTYEGACTDAFIQGFDGYVIHDPYELRPEWRVPRASTHRSAADIGAELRAIGKQVAAARGQED